LSAAFQTRRAYIRYWTTERDKQKANLRNCIEGMWRPLLTPGYMPAVVIAGTPADFACSWKPFARQE